MGGEKYILDPIGVKVFTRLNENESETIYQAQENENESETLHQAQENEFETIYQAQEAA